MLFILLGGLPGLGGCNQAPRKEGVFLVAGGYPSLKRYEMEEKISSPSESRTIRQFFLKDTELSGAPGVKAGRRSFYIRLSVTTRDFKIIRITGPEVVRYSYLDYQPAVKFSFVPGKLYDNEENLLLEASLKPGNYLIVPWENYLPFGKYGYGFKVK
ncbi:MAG: hypothetical protein ACE5GM_03535 [bacterium]